MPAQEDPPAGAPEWVVTYGDMMSLLLTFFIMLVSMSELKKDDGKFRAMLDALKQVFGPHLGKMGAPGTSLQTTSAYGKIASLGQSAEGGLEKANRRARGPGGPGNPVRRLRDGSVVTLGGPVVFQPFSADLNPAAETDLDAVIQAVLKKTHRIEVRGHTSPAPLPDGSPFRDPLDLSFHRAHRVAAYLTRHGIDPLRVRVSAAGDTEPRTLTRDSTAQSVNDRVDVFLIDSYISPPPN